jgi:hypothetical protein
MIDSWDRLLCSLAEGLGLDGLIGVSDSLLVLSDRRAMALGSWVQMTDNLAELLGGWVEVKDSCFEQLDS